MKASLGGVQLVNVIVMVSVDPHRHGQASLNGVPQSATCTPYKQELSLYFLLIGIAALLMKFLQFGPVFGWSWWLVLSPFAMAVIWWAWADRSGYTKRVEMEKMERRKSDRIERQRQAMSLLSKKRK